MNTNNNDYEYVEKNIWTPFSILNGRVNAIPDNKFKVANNLPILQSEQNLNTITRTYTQTDVATHFFSSENIELIQDSIIKKVYYDSNYKITKQSYQELNIIMRSIYLQHGKNSNFNIRQQIIDLNKLVIDWSVKEIIKNIMQYDSYIETVSTMPMPLEKPQYATQKGTRILEIKTML
jgi:hypothetical protein